MKKKLMVFFLALMLCVTTIPVAVTANTLKGKINNSGYKTENEIYFNLPHRGLMKYDVESGDAVKLNSLKQGDGYSTWGVTIISHKGEWLYGEWNQTTGTAYNEGSYIVRINAKTGKIIKLAEGTQPVVKGKKIYFSGLDKEEVDFGEYNYKKSERNYVCDLYGKHLKKTNKKIKIKTTNEIGKNFKLYKKYNEKGTKYNMNVILKFPNGNKEIIGKYFES